MFSDSPLSAGHCAGHEDTMVGKTRICFLPQLSSESSGRRDRWKPNNPKVKCEIASVKERRGLVREYRTRRGQPGGSFPKTEMLSACPRAENGGT